jgi:pyrimidine-nucleoside phosphorylase
MRVIDIIRKKRTGQELSREEIHHLVSGYARDLVPDYQMSAWLMAAFLQGLSRAELAALTESMLHSGEVLDFSDLQGRKVDKHSTGGVGDKTSLVIAPIVAAGGVLVPMISGRGLGHTGGTLDKLESIPGFRVDLSLKEFRSVIETAGCSLIGQTGEIAPADKKIYALRDVTATVDNPNLICASIMSKKLAEGIDALVLDVKTGSGAFMKEESEAAALAELMVETGTRMGKEVVALITDMNQPLGRAVGNALEVIECIEVLRGGGPEDLRALCLELSGWMFYLGRRTPDVAEGRRLAERLLADGSGLEKFREIIRLQHGDPAVLDDTAKMPRARHQLDIPCPESGVIEAIECEQIGIAGIVLGGGREKKEDGIDPAVGMVLHKKIGDDVSAGEPLLTVHYNSDARLQEACALLRPSFRISKNRPCTPRPLVRRIIGGNRR